MSQNQPQQRPFLLFGKVLIAVVLFSGIACSTTPTVDETFVEAPRRSNEIGTTGYRTSVGDALDIFVLEDGSFNGLYVVRPSGDIIIPKAGRIPVANMSLGQVESTIKSVLETNQLAKATVIADPVRRGAGDGESVTAGLTVYLSGNVVKTGRVLVPFVGDGKVTAFQAVMDSGGFKQFANKRKSYLLRKDHAGRTSRVAVDFTEIEKGIIPDVPLQDGDMLVVPQKMFGL